jgi:uncharacterized protein YqgC (DUF456 family)
VLHIHQGMKSGVQGARIESLVGMFGLGAFGLRIVDPGLAHKKQVFVMHNNFLSIIPG